jgi:hypothetical protein
VTEKTRSIRCFKPNLPASLAVGKGGIGVGAWCVNSNSEEDMRLPHDQRVHLTATGSRLNERTTRLISRSHSEPPNSSSRKMTFPVSTTGHAAVSPVTELPPTQRVALV